jgi:hypothetical protein
MGMSAAYTSLLFLGPVMSQQVNDMKQKGIPLARCASYIPTKQKASPA